MRKYVKVLFVLALCFSFSNLNVKAAENNPFKSINYCGIVTISGPATVNLMTSNNNCNVAIELNDSSYSVVSGNGVLKLENGANEHKIVLKNSAGEENEYIINVNYNTFSGSTNSSSDGIENPKTGSFVPALSIGLLSVAGILLIKTGNKKIIHKI